MVCCFVGVSCLVEFRDVEVGGSFVGRVKVGVRVRKFGFGVVVVIIGYYIFLLIFSTKLILFN